MEQIEKKIQKFIDSKPKLTPATVKKYKKSLVYLIDELKIKTEDDFLSLLTGADRKTKDYIILFKNYLQFHKEASEKINEHLTSKEIYNYTNDYKVLNTRKDIYKTLNQKTMNRNDKLLIDLLFNYPNLRGDWANVKISDIVDDKITFTKLNKIGDLKVPIVFTLNETTKALIDYSEEYLLYFTSTNRSAALSKKVKRLTGYSINDLRKACSRENIEQVSKKYNITRESFIEMYKELDELENLSGHQLSTAVNYYY